MKICPKHRVRKVLIRAKPCNYLRCRLCARDRNKNWRCANRKHCREYGRLQHRIHRKKRLAGMRRWRLAHPEKCRASNRKCYLANPKKYVANARRWRRSNPEALTAITHRRLARKRAGGSFTSAEWIDLKIFYCLRCLCCGKTDRQLKRLGRVLAPDHVKPLAKGGRNDIANIQPLCHGRGGCNNRKAVKHVDYRRKRHD